MTQFAPPTIHRIKNRHPNRTGAPEASDCVRWKGKRGAAQSEPAARLRSRTRARRPRGATTATVSCGDDRHARRLSDAPALGQGCTKSRLPAGYMRNFIPNIPGASNAAAQTNAEVKLANWNHQYGMVKIPAAKGTVARNGPKKRPTKIPTTPQRRTNLSPRGSKSGCRDS